MNNRDVNPDFHGLKSSDGDAAAVSGVCVCTGGRHMHRHTHTHMQTGNWSLDRGPWMNCVLTYTNHLAIDGDVWGREGRLSMLKEVLPSGSQTREEQASTLLPVKGFTAPNSALPSLSIYNIDRAYSGPGQFLSTFLRQLLT